MEIEMKMIQFRFCVRLGMNAMWFRRTGVQARINNYVPVEAVGPGTYTRAAHMQRRYRPLPGRRLTTHAPTPSPPPRYGFIHPT